MNTIHLKFNTIHFFFCLEKKETEIGTTISDKISGHWSMILKLREEKVRKRALATCFVRNCSV